MSKMLVRQPPSPSLAQALGAGRRRWLMAGLVGCGVWALAGCADLQPPAGVEPVAPFDLQRYQGRWYEVARLDHRFERGLTDVSAIYEPQANGSVRVINRGYDTEAKRWRQAIGTAYFTLSPTVGSLKVSFFGPFYGGYHVAALDPDYRWSLVLGPDAGYCWILSREPELPPEVRSRLLAKAKSLGVRTDQLIWVTHTLPDPVM